MVLYFMLEALDALKAKYLVFMVKVHSSQKVVHTVWALLCKKKIAL